MRRFDLHQPPLGVVPPPRRDEAAQMAQAAAQAAANAGVLLGFVLGVGVTLFALWAF